MSAQLPNCQSLKIEFSDWLNSYSAYSFNIHTGLQGACLEDSIEAFYSQFPSYSNKHHDHEMRWLLNKWISNVTLVLDSLSDDVLRYRGIEIPKDRLEDIKPHLLNDIRKTVAACYRSKTKFIN